MTQLSALAPLSLPHLPNEPALAMLLAYSGNFRTDRIFHSTRLTPRPCNVATRSFAKRGHHALTLFAEHTGLLLGMLITTPQLATQSFGSLHNRSDLGVKGL
jgi:hypothetical protein